MTVAYKLVHETFTSRVTLDRNKLEILVEYLRGPFRKMNNRWNFRPAGEGACDVEFFIVYEFRSRTLGLLMGAMFEAAFRRFSAAFERRADQVYGACAIGAVRRLTIPTVCSPRRSNSPPRTGIMASPEIGRFGCRAMFFRNSLAVAAACLLAVALLR